MKAVSVREGIGFGAALAMVIGYANNHSIGWTIFDGFLGWFYVISAAIQ